MSARPAEVMAQALTCRAWNQPATEVLYRRVNLITLRESRLFFYTMQHSARLCQHVRTLYHYLSSLMERRRFATLLCDILKLLWNLDSSTLTAVFF